jgi:AraC family transcriptional regulator, positive regulator of tynA and feaB
MEVAFSTADVHPRDRFDYWQAATRERIADHDSSISSRDGFKAELSVGRVGSLGLVRSCNSEIQVASTNRHAACSDPSEILLFCLLAGRILLEQSDRRVSLDAGSLACVDPRLAHTMHFLDQSSTLIIKVSRTELEARLGTNFDIAACRIAPLGPQERLTLFFAAKLEQLSGTLDRTSEETISTQAIDLIALSLGNAVDRPTQLPANKSRLVWHIHRAIDARLQNTDLTPERIAERVGISVRQANRLLGTQGSSLMRLVQTKRLARCRHALEDPRQIHRSVSDIALGWGFSDLTHFSRSFKRAYGILPSDLRKLKESR